MLTFDQLRQMDAQAPGLRVGRQQTHDGRWVDSTGAFLVGELERLDQTLNMPLVDVQYTRDIDLRVDATIADEWTSFTTSNIASAGGLGTGNGIGNGKAWIGKTTTEVTGVGLDINKLANPLDLYGLEVKYTIPELESAIKMGRPIDQQKFEAMNLKYQMDCDEQAYIGDTTKRVPGLLNSNLIVPTVQNLPNGTGGSPKWSLKTPDEILADFNLALTTVWKASGYAIKPSRVIIPPAQYGYIATAKVATAAGLVSIKRYIEENNLLAADGGPKLEIVPSKWAVGAGVGGTIGANNSVDRMVVYTKDYRRVRFPLTQMQRTPLEVRGLYHITTYFCRLGVVEMPYPETVGYFDGL